MKLIKQYPDVLRLVVFAVIGIIYLFNSNIDKELMTMALSIVLPFLILMVLGGILFILMISFLTSKR